MDSKDILKATEVAKRLIQDEQYYKYIFKKTERIVSVVFYILNSVPDNPQSQVHVEDLSHAARSVHDAVLQSLEARTYAAEDVVRGVAHSLISLESKLSVAQAAGIISSEVLTVFNGEIDSVLRGINKYMSDDSAIMSFEAPAPTASVTAPKRTPATAASQASAAPRTTPAPDNRRERIKTILEAKGEASIKDISEIITDVSEKTIQRELQAMIEDNIVKRQGERRWSRYLLF